MNRALIIKSTGSWHEVVDLDNGTTLKCRIRGKLRLKGVRTTNPVSVGDIVNYITEESSEELSGVITAIEPRRNYIIRRSTNLSKESHIIAANVDKVFLIVTLDFPVTSDEFIDRFLVSCEMFHLPATIVLNKMDIFANPDFDEIINDFCNKYNAAGYDVLPLSATEGLGVDKLREMTSGKVSLFAGNSGVGKSTIVSLLCGDVTIKIGEISDAHNSGKHTTTFSQMFPLISGGYLIDTPGIKGFGLIDIEPEEIARYFPDLFRYVSECRFYNCTHTHEPGCAVKSAVESGELSEERYSSYLKILEEEDPKYRR